jgi:hypothetical protein
VALQRGFIGQNTPAGISKQENWARAEFSTGYLGAPITVFLESELRSLCDMAATE